MADLGLEPHVGVETVEALIHDHGHERLAHTSVGYGYRALPDFLNEHETICSWNYVCGNCPRPVDRRGTNSSEGALQVFWHTALEVPSFSLNSRAPSHRARTSTSPDYVPPHERFALSPMEWRTIIWVHSARTRRVNEPPMRTSSTSPNSLETATAVFTNANTTVKYLRSGLLTCNQVACRCCAPRPDSLQQPLDNHQPCQGVARLVAQWRLEWNAQSLSRIRRSYHHQNIDLSTSRNHSGGHGVQEQSGT